MDSTLVGDEMRAQSRQTPLNSAGQPNESSGGIGGLDVQCTLQWLAGTHAAVARACTGSRSIPGCRRLERHGADSVSIVPISEGDSGTGGRLSIRLDAVDRVAEDPS